MRNIVLITGATGYLGGRISKKLSERGGYFLRLSYSGRRAGLSSKLKNSESKILDLSGVGKLDGICKGVRSIIHLAAMNSAECASDPERAVKVNTIGTLRLLEAARRQKVKRFIYFSTGHVYGSPLTGRIAEGLLTRPAHPYSITHRSAEDLVLSSGASGGPAGTVIRLSNAVGAPADPGTDCWSLVVNDLCRQAVTGNKLVLKTSGLQYRDFVAIEDISAAVVHLLSLPINLCQDQIFNLGSGKAMSVIDMARFIRTRCRAVIGSYPEIVVHERPSGKRPSRLDYRIDRIRSVGFRPKNDLKKEIDDTLIFCQNVFGKKLI